MTLPVTNSSGQLSFCFARLIAVVPSVELWTPWGCFSVSVNCLFCESFSKFCFCGHYVYFCFLLRDQCVFSYGETPRIWPDTDHQSVLFLQCECLYGWAWRFRKKKCRRYGFEQVTQRLGNWGVLLVAAVHTVHDLALWFSVCRSESPCRVRQAHNFLRSTLPRLVIQALFAIASMFAVPWSARITSRFQVVQCCFLGTAFVTLWLCQIFCSFVAWAVNSLSLRVASSSRSMLRN